MEEERSRRRETVQYILYVRERRRGQRVNAGVLKCPTSAIIRLGTRFDSTCKSFALNIHIVSVSELVLELTDRQTMLLLSSKQVQYMVGP
jgi:hypothetical protein